VVTLSFTRQPPAPAPSPSVSKSQPSAGQPRAGEPGAARAAASTQSVGSSPSVLAAIGFSCVTLLVAGVGFAYSRRRRPRA
jgi:hypothetical protein